MRAHACSKTTRFTRLVTLVLLAALVWGMLPAPSFAEESTPGDAAETSPETLIAEDEQPSAADQGQPEAIEEAEQTPAETPAEADNAIVAESEDAIGPAEGIEAEAAASISYRTHVQKYGWQSWKKDGAVSGTSGESKRLEGIIIQLGSKPCSGSIRYRTHVQSIGWQGWVQEGVMSGTSHQSKRLEAIEIELTGEMANRYDVWYRVHAQKFGWMGWAKNGARSGTATYARRLEAIQIVLVEKGAAGPGANYMGIAQRTAAAYATRSIRYKTHVQRYGWQGWKYDGEMSGTSGESKRLEGINIELPDKPCSGGIEYRTHVQSIGWQGWVRDGAMSGTSGQRKRLEAIQIQLYGEMANKYDVYYRVHAQTFGWLGWAKNGERAGTAGMAKRLEGIEIRLVSKGGAAPGSTADPYFEKTATNDIAFVIRYFDKAQQVVALVNAERAKAGVPALTIDSSLEASAMQRAAEITKKFDHTRPNGTSCFSLSEKIYGENIAYGSDTPSGVVRLWMNSAGHRANILSDYFSSIGVGCVSEPNGATYWVQLFGWDYGDGQVSGTGQSKRAFNIPLVA